MDIGKAIINEVIHQQGKTFFTQSELAERAGIDQSTISRIIQRKETITLRTANSLLSALGGELVFPQSKEKKEKIVDAIINGIGVRFPGPDITKYTPVPVFDRYTLPENIDAESCEAAKRWFLNRPVVTRFGLKLIAIEMDAEDEGMSPLLKTGDLAVVDMADNNKIADEPYNLYLIRTPPPQNKLIVRHVKLYLWESKDQNICILSPEPTSRLPMLMYDVDKDLNGTLSNLILGRVISIHSYIN